MTGEQLQLLYNKRPFKPFIIHLADGRGLKVAHPDFLSAKGGKRTFRVHHEDGRSNIVDLLLVTDLEVGP